MTTINIPAINLERPTTNVNELTDIKFLLSNHVNIEFDNLKILLNHLPYVQDQAQQQELQIFLQNTVYQLEKSLTSLNQVVFQDADNSPKP